MLEKFRKRLPIIATAWPLFLTIAMTSNAIADVEQSNLSALELKPARMELIGNRARQQLVLTGKLNSHDVRDLTHEVQFVSSAPGVVKVVDSVAIPVSNGTATITARFGNLRANATVHVKQFDQHTPVSFKNETLAALTKAGCNMGACHGSPSGKAGFRLSLRGYDPPLDIMTLRTEAFGRRTNVMDPAESLILKKPLMQVAHGGGRRLTKGDPAYVVLHGWISEGLRLDADDVPDLLRIEVYPQHQVLRNDAAEQQLYVQGHFSDGTVRDLTALTAFSSSNESAASVSESGLVDKTGRGETAILARYLDKMATSNITFLEDIEGFAWSNPPENNFIDELVFEKLETLQILPSELCSDEEFLRRAYLDATGRLPSIDETRAFLQSSDPKKRQALIDHILDTDDYAEFWTLKWADVLRSNSKKLRKSGAFKFHRWLYDNIRNDTPLDQFANQLLTAQGSVYENPPANFWRASRDPQDATETTAQLFLGIRIQCAKCHNHPFERWTQDNYYGIAAAFARVGRTPGSAAGDEVIYVQPNGEIKQPRTGETMKVHLLLEGDVDVPEGADRRRVFADWLTGPQNPFFAKAAVNRIWGHLMGRGIVEPVDDFRDSNPASNSALLDELSSQFVENGFSQKWVVRAIMNSRTYQLSSNKNRFNSDDDVYASHATTRLLGAEQLLDAICQVTDVGEQFRGVPKNLRAVSLPDPPTDHYFLKIFGQPQREMACECERSTESNLSQALQMINGPVVHNKLRDDNGRIARGIETGNSDKKIICDLYMAALCRNPSESEMNAALAHISASSDRRLALEDIGWAILNSKEFLFQH